MPAPAPFAGRPAAPRNRGGPGPLSRAGQPKKQKRPAPRAGRKEYGDALRAPARQGWAGAAPAENRKQRSDTGGPGVLRTPGRRAPHRNGGTFGSFSHERTTIQREDGKKTAIKPTRQVSNTATLAKANKEKSSVRGAGGCGVPRSAGSAARQGARLPATSAGPLVLSVGERTTPTPYSRIGVLGRSPFFTEASSWVTISFMLAANSSSEELWKISSESG